MRKISDKADYMRTVLAYLAALESEDQTLLNDLSIEGIEGDMRRAAIDGVIAEMWDQNLVDFCTAMRIAGITAQQAAQVIKSFNTMHERRES